MTNQHETHARTILENVGSDAMKHSHKTVRGALTCPVCTPAEKLEAILSIQEQAAAAALRLMADTRANGRTIL